MNLLPSIIQTLLDGLTILGIPIFCVFFARLLTHRLALEEFMMMPIFSRLCVLAGIAFGLAMLQSFTPAQGFVPELIFAVDGPWDLTTAQFLLERVNPFFFIFNGFAIQQYSEFVRLVFFVLLGIASALVLIIAVVALRDRTIRQGMRVIIAALGNILLNSYLLFYTVSALLWLLNTLNFWVFWLLLLLLRWPFDFPKARFRHH